MGIRISCLVIGSCGGYLGLMKELFCPGISTLLAEQRECLAGKRIGLVSNAASIDSLGCSTAELLWRDRQIELVALLAPEHGYFGTLGAGKKCSYARHPEWGLPIFSLYGKARKPSAKMLKNIDLIIFDLQDIGARCYTYVSTLRNVLEAAAELGKEVIVADRPVPLPRVVDGPLLQKGFESFVAHVRTPMSYGMTPAETALWIQHELGLDLELGLALMKGYQRDGRRGVNWTPWFPPSPGMRSWESAMCFPATVCFEALGSVDHGRTTNLAFQVLGSKWMNGTGVTECLRRRELPGVQFYAHRYAVAGSMLGDRVMDGVRMSVTAPHHFRPVLTGLTIVACLQELYGVDQVWAKKTARPEFFDKLFGTDEVRESLMAGEDASAIAAAWPEASGPFMLARSQCLQYGETPDALISGT